VRFISGVDYAYNTIFVFYILYVANNKPLQFLIFLCIHYANVLFCKNVPSTPFFATGIAIILAGFMNIVVIRIGNKDKLIFALCLLTNIFFATLFAFALLQLRQPQVFLGLFLFAGSTVAAIKAK
jgi:hypothetical protein